MTLLNIDGMTYKIKNGRVFYRLHGEWRLSSRKPSELKPTKLEKNRKGK